jgi:hypothetical protein
MQHLTVKSPEASRLRQRKYELVRTHVIPEDLVGGCLAQTRRRCGKPNCHCAAGRGHPLWSLTFSMRGKRRVERVPEAWVAELEQAVLQTQAYLDAVKEVMAINIELLALARAEQQARKRTLRARKAKKRTPRAKNGSTIGAGDRS